MFLFSALFSTVVNTAFPSATTDDVISSTNKALVKLTNQINIQFENMKAYVDQKFLTEKKTELQAKLESLRIILKECYRRNRASAAECLDKKYTNFKKEEPFFFPLRKDLDRGDELSNYQIHLLEV